MEGVYWEGDAGNDRKRLAKIMKLVYLGNSPAGGTSYPCSSRNGFVINPMMLLVYRPVPITDLPVTNLINTTFSVLCLIQSLK